MIHTVFTSRRDPHAEKDKEKQKPLHQCPGSCLQGLVKDVTVYFNEVMLEPQKTEYIQ